MKAKEYLEKLTVLVEKYPDAEVIVGTDNEGNRFYPVYYRPSTGVFKDGEFENNVGKKVNAICLN